MCIHTIINENYQADPKNKTNITNYILDEAAPRKRRRLSVAEPDVTREPRIAEPDVSRIPDITMEPEIPLLQPPDIDMTRQEDVSIPVRLIKRLGKVPGQLQGSNPGFPQSLKSPWILGFPWKVLENEFVLEKSLKLGDLPWNFNW